MMTGGMGEHANGRERCERDDARTCSVGPRMTILLSRWCTQTIGDCRSTSMEIGGDRGFGRQSKVRKVMRLMALDNGRRLSA